MNRSTRTAVVIFIATLTAAIASYGVYVAVKSIPVREVEVAHSYIAVASKTLPTGSRVTDRDVKLVPWPQNSPIAGSFDKIEPILNRGLLSSVVENEPLTETKLAPIESGAGLPPTIPEGMRAMSVKVDEVIGVAGFVVPGTRVDVVVTLRADGTAQAMARTVVSDVLVLTSGTRYDQEQAKDGKPLPSTVVTLAVAPNDAERIALAGAEGKISLALRNPMDKAPTETTGVRIAGLMGVAPAPSAPSPAPQRAARAVTPVIAPAAPVPPAIYKVETIRAAKRTEEVVQ